MSGSGKGGTRLGSARSGTLRFFVAFGAGLVGVVFLVLALTPLATGRIEIEATATDIDTIEREGFPQATFLEVKDGNIVFAHARVWLSRRGGGRRLFQLAAPVVSDTQLEAWERGRDAGEPLDLSGLRLVAVFDGDQVAALWPEEPLDVQSAQMPLIGETVTAKGQISLPTFPSRRAMNLDWAHARRLRHGVHHDSVGRLLKNLAIAVTLLMISFLTFRYHRRHPTRSPPGGLDLTPVFDGPLDL